MPAPSCQENNDFVAGISTPHLYRHQKQGKYFGLCERFLNIFAACLQFGGEYGIIE
jgi:hypothetical protein